MTRNVSIIIPSIKEEIRTLESIPADVPVTVEREGTLNEARNRGVENAETEIVAIMDDDIAFSERLFFDLIEYVERDMLLGVADWEFGLVAGRVMIFHKDLWEDLGGFDERLQSHNGDTDFSLRAYTAGYDVTPVPRGLFDHEEHDRSITTWDRLWRLGYLGGKFPRFAPYLLSCALMYNLSQLVGIDREAVVPPEIGQPFWGTDAETGPASEKS